MKLWRIVSCEVLLRRMVIVANRYSKMATTLRRLVRLNNFLIKTCKIKGYRKISTSVCSRHNDLNTKQTHFGFQTVPENEKEEKVYEVFRNVADKYDLMNDAMSVGVHRLWKDTFIKRLSPIQGTRLIDVAGGTGDIAFRCLDFVHSLKNKTVSGNVQMTQENEDTIITDVQWDHVTDSDRGNFESDLESSVCHVTVCDINQSMLDVGKDRAQELGKRSGLSWIKGNAECLPFENNSFDAYTIAFGIRNCTHIDQVVREAYRVLKPGGRFMCLEFSHVSNPVLRSVYDEYSFQVIPALGQVLAADWQSYQYLVESIRQFPNQEDFKDIIRMAGFSAVTYENLTFGVVAIHSGFKL